MSEDKKVFSISYENLTTITYLIIGFIVSLIITKMYPIDTNRPFSDAIVTGLARAVITVGWPIFVIGILAFSLFYLIGSI